MIDSLSIYLVLQNLLSIWDWICLRLDGDWIHGGQLDLVIIMNRLVNKFRRTRHTSKLFSIPISKLSHRNVHVQQVACHVVIEWWARRRRSIQTTKTFRLLICQPMRDWVCPRFKPINVMICIDCYIPGFLYFSWSPGGRFVLPEADSNWICLRLVNLPPNPKSTDSTLRAVRQWFDTLHRGHSIGKETENIFRRFTLEAKQILQRM